MLDIGSLENGGSCRIRFAIFNQIPLSGSLSRCPLFLMGMDNIFLRLTGRATSI